MKKKKHRPSESRTHDAASYVCDSCGEEIVVPVDVSAGESQTSCAELPWRISIGGTISYRISQSQPPPF